MTDSGKPSRTTARRWLGRLPLLGRLKRGLFPARVPSPDPAVREALNEIRDLVLDIRTQASRHQHPNPLNRSGAKGFSQADEDGITLEIVRRLGLDNGTYAEFGVGNGLENNTLILASLGWKGFWVGNEELPFSHERATRFRYIRSWITKDNVVTLARSGMAASGTDTIDVLSLDLDGNDLHLVAALLADGVTPRLFIVEYNAQFPPPAKFCIDYDPQHRWQGDNHFGAALQDFDELFRSHGYRLVCCNAQTGANAFFVRTADADRFRDVPEDLAMLYMPPRYILPSRYGHRQSPKVVEMLLNR